MGYREAGTFHCGLIGLPHTDPGGGCEGTRPCINALGSRVVPWPSRCAQLLALPRGDGSEPRAVRNIQKIWYDR